MNNKEQYTALQPHVVFDFHQIILSLVPSQKYGRFQRSSVNVYRLLHANVRLYQALIETRLGPDAVSHVPRPGANTSRVVTLHLAD
jgi:hypothetical protein